MNDSLDFSNNDYNGFYYTPDKYIKRMDDEFILSKIIEKYPDFSISNPENQIRQVFLVIVNDNNLITDILKKFDLSVQEFFSIIYRNYSNIFNSIYVSKIQKLISNKKYVKSTIKSIPGSKKRRTKKEQKRRGPGRPPKNS